MTCKLCEKPVRASGLCMAHYQEKRRASMVQVAVTEKTRLAAMVDGRELSEFVRLAVANRVESILKKRTA